MTRALQGRLVVVTGGSSGVGAAAVSALASRGATLVASYRDAARAERMASEVRAKGGDVLPFALDLEERPSIHAFAALVQGLGRPVHALVHNAGAVYPKERRTADGLDAQAAVLHHGPLLLTHLLLDAMARPSRIVEVVSDLHRRAGAGDLEARGPYRFLRSYERAELAKLLAAQELARRLRSREIDVNAVHPGGVRTRLFRSVGGPLGLLSALAQPLRMSPEAGARAIVHAVCELPAGTTGTYLVNGRLGVSVARASRVAYDEALARRVYEEGCRTAGIAPLPPVSAPGS